MTNPAAETKAIGLLANAQMSWFLQSIYKVHLDKLTTPRQPGLIRNIVLPGRDNFVPSTL
jgi:hypothetical protein